MRGDLLLYWLYQMGHVPFNHPAPDGYPDLTEAWGRALLPRWRFASTLFDYELYGILPDWDLLAGQVGTWRRRDAADQINMVLTGGVLPPRDLRRIREFIDQGTSMQWQTGELLREAFALAASSPGYQFY